jgi:hypothetical protein
VPNITLIDASAMRPSHTAHGGHAADRRRKFFFLP